MCSLGGAAISIWFPLPADTVKDPERETTQTWGRVIKGHTSRRPGGQMAMEESTGLQQTELHSGPEAGGRGLHRGQTFGLRGCAALPRARRRLQRVPLRSVRARG